MSGPWEKFKSPEAEGPWSKFAKTAKDYNSPEALAAEADLTKMAAHKAEQTPASIAVRSVARGLSGGFLDEGVGALGAVVDQIKGTDKTFGESYDANRDEQRLKQRADDINNPIATTVGHIGGGVATGALLPGAATLSGSVGYGALQGAGESDREGLDMLKDASIGGAFGAAGYGVGKLIGKGIEKAPSAYRALKNLPEAAESVAEGVKNTAGKVGHIADTFTDTAKADDGLLTKFPEWSGIPIVSRLGKGTVAAAKEVRAAKQLSSEFDDAAKALQKTFGPGTATDLSQSDILMKKLLEEGIIGEPNIAHRLVASKFAAAHGGNADDYLKLITRSADDLAEAKAFNPISASEEIAPKFEDAYKTLRSESSKRYGQLSDEARSQFQKIDSKPIQDLQGILGTIEEDTTISATSKNYLREAMKKLGDDFADLEPAEQFDRLVAAKDKLKGGAKWASRNEVPEGAAAVRDASKSVDQYLKALEGRKTADAEWTALSGLDDEFFKKVGIVKNGRVTGIDPIKLESLFSGAKSGRQLQKQLVKAQELIDSGKLPADKVANIKDVLAILKKSSDTSQLSRDLSRFRYADAGPSSPAIQRAAAVAGKDSAVTTAVRAPQIFLSMKANASKLAQSNFGKPFEQLPSGDKDTIAKLALWLSQNDGATDIDIARQFTKLKAGK